MSDKPCKLCGYSHEAWPVRAAKCDKARVIRLQSELTAKDKRISTLEEALGKTAKCTACNHCARIAKQALESDKDTRPHSDTCAFNRCWDCDCGLQAERDSNG